MSKFGFEIGDRVSAIKGTSSNNNMTGLVGVVVHLMENSSPPIGVKFSVDVKGHDCNGYCKDGYGWYLNPECLKKAENNKNNKESSNLEYAQVTNQPRYHHSTIEYDDGKVENLCEPIEKSSYKVIFNGTTTIVLMDDGSKGIAKCSPEDEYDAMRGLEIATLKAYIKSAQKELKKLSE